MTWSVSTGVRVKSNKRFAIEYLEERCVLAGETFLVNFQLAGAPTPNRYLADTGAVFGNRGGGLFYGWSSNHTDVSRDRDANADQRLDTLVHFHQFQQWEFQLPNGQYDVTASIGDPSNPSSHTLNVEGTNYWTNEFLSPNQFRVQTRTVTVSDGRLTLNQGNAIEKATRINYVHIQGKNAGGNAAPMTPEITEPASGSGPLNPGDVHMEAINFFDGDGDTHLSTDWEIWTTDAVPQRAWLTLGIGGVERLHTHMGDGFFENSHAGRTELFANTSYELRVRFRDSAGSVSNDATRIFQTGSASTVFPMEITDVATAPAPTWQNILGANIELPSAGAILSPGNPIIGIDTDGGSSSPDNETPQNAIDGTLAKYLNFGEVNSGLIVTPASSASIVKRFQITTANDAEERDPTSWQLFGTNSAILSTNNSNGNAEPWTLIASGNVALPSARNTLGPMVEVSNNIPYASYRMLFTGVKDEAAANSMQIGEVQFFADSAGSFVPPSLRVESANSDLLLMLEGTSAAGNLVTNPSPLPNHAEIRVRLSAGTIGLSLPISDLTFTDDDGRSQVIYLPAISLLPNQEIILWVSLNGSTYYGNPRQTQPDFSSLARSASSTVNFIATQPNYIVEVVASGFQLPVNVAFIPNAGTAPNDPAFYVTELYGTIKVVTNGGAVSDYATGLLNFNPTGNFPGSGEQGLAGLAVDPLTGDVFVSRVTDTDGVEGGDHHPQVLRFSSNDGGRTASSQSVILNMIGESQGQSHQISNVSIGPDGKLYVHNGDGFDAGTALNLDSYRGKVLRLNLDGTPPTDNPFYNAANGINARDYVFAYGFRNPFGGAWRESDGRHYEVENGPSVDRLARVDRGVSYGWNGSDASMFINARYNWDPAHAPVNIAFVQPGTFGGSGFPAEKQDRAFVSESGPTYAQGPQSRGKRIVEFQMNANGDVVGGPTTLVEYVGQGRATVVGLAAGREGIYFTDLYKDLNATSPIEAGARVLRVRYVPPRPDGDFNNDGLWNCLDIDQLTAAIAAQTHVPAFDLTGDALVDALDRDAWLVEAGANNPAVTNGNPFRQADANLDGAVDGSDFGIWNSNKFTNSSAWCQGNFNSDAVVDGSDFGIWNSNKFTSSDAVQNAADPNLPLYSEKELLLKPIPAVNDPFRNAVAEGVLVQANQSLGNSLNGLIDELARVRRSRPRFSPLPDDMHRRTKEREPNPLSLPLEWHSQFSPEERAQRQRSQSSVSRAPRGS
jgi:glucose/arabinose dehydrogenase